MWLAGGALTLFALARQHLLKPTQNTKLKDQDAPLVSVLVPARNEERRCLRECVGSILAQDYGSFEVVALDDRSTDSTGRILRALATRDARLRVIEGEETPRGWLGKPYALHQALAAARGEWVLATDADMIFHAAALRTAVACAAEQACDALTFVPHFEALSFWERVCAPVFLWVTLIMFPRELAQSRKTSLAVGVGGFFLIRRAALERVGGFAAVRAEVLDDVRLAEILKADGAHTCAEFAPALVSTRMYTTLGELWEGMTKNTFAILRFSPVLALLMLVWAFFVAILPHALAAASVLMVALHPSDPYFRQLLVPSLLTWLVFIAQLALVNRRGRIPARYALTAPLGWLIGLAVLFASAYGVLTGKGLVWKGRRFYESGGVRPPRGSRRDGPRAAP